MNWRKEVDEFKSGLTVSAPMISAQSIKFGFFGSVGGGKSVTAGIFAVAITPTGLIGWVDGEAKRSSWAIDIVADMASKKYGGTKQSWIDRFKTVHIDPPFNPLRVIAATEVLEEMGCKTIIEDVMSQAWSSEGGYLDIKDEKLDEMAGDDAAKRYKSAAAAAAQVKPWTHQKLVNKIESSKANLVLLFQAKQKFNAKTSKPNEFQSPIQESGLTRTAIAVGRVEANVDGEGGYCSFQCPMEQGTKYTHPSILAALPKNGEQFRFEHGEAILRLCGGSPATNKPPIAPPVASGIKKKLWDLTRKIHFEKREALEQYLWDENLMDPDKALADLTESELRAVYQATENKIREGEGVTP